MQQDCAACCKTDGSLQQKKSVLPCLFSGLSPKELNPRVVALEAMGYEVVAFHANGTGGMAMEETAAEGYFKGLLDFATHELADHFMNGYCGASRRKGI